MITIFDILAYGPIVAGSEEHGYLVTINGVCLNLWHATDNGAWEHLEMRHGNPTLYDMTAAQAIEYGEQWLDELMNPGSDADGGTPDDNQEK